jgi:hypothetical protein
LLHERFEEQLALVRSEGSVLDGEELKGSVVILPPPDTSFVEASEDFTGDGLWRQVSYLAIGMRWQGRTLCRRGGSNPCCR